MKKEKNQKTIGRKDRILKVASRIIAKKGYRSATLEDIANELGITTPAIYYYFKSKQDIIEEITDTVTKPLEELIEIGKSDLLPTNKLRRMIRHIIEINTENRERAVIYFEETNALPEKTRERIRIRQKEFERTINETLRKGSEQGYFAVTDTKMASLAILAVCNWTYRWYRQRGELTPTQIADRLIDMLENGYLRTPSETKDMIYSGDETIYPPEVEEILCQHPSVNDAIVIGVPDPYWMERIHAVIALKARERFTDYELIHFCKTRLPHYKVPKSVEFVDRLPSNTSREMVRAKLREKYRAGRNNI